MGQGYIEGWVEFGIVSIESLVSASRELAVHLTFSMSQLLCLIKNLVILFPCAGAASLLILWYN